MVRYAGTPAEPFADDSVSADFSVTTTTAPPRSGANLSSRTLRAGQRANRWSATAPPRRSHSPTPACRWTSHLLLPSRRITAGPVLGHYAVRIVQLSSSRRAQLLLAFD